MKRMRRLLSAAGVVCLTAGLLSGCQNVTAEGLMAEAAENVKEVDSFQGTMEMDMGLGIAESSVSMGLDLNVSMDMEAVRDPNIYHIDGSVGMDLLDLTFDMEAYGETTEDETVVYINVGDTWQKQTVDASEGENMGNLLNLDLYTQAARELTLEEETEEINGQEVYVVTTTFDGDDFSEVMDNLSGLMDEEMTGSLDLTELTVDVTLKIYEDSRLPATVSMVMKDGAPVVYEQEGMEMTLENLSYEIVIQDYNTIEQIEIPAEALEAEVIS